MQAINGDDHASECSAMVSNDLDTCTNNESLQRRQGCGVVVHRTGSSCSWSSVILTVASCASKMFAGLIQDQRSTFGLHHPQSRVAV